MIAKMTEQRRSIQTSIITNRAIETILLDLEGAAHWRSTKATDYPEDRRIETAVILLTRLTAEVHELQHSATAINLEKIQDELIKLTEQNNRGELTDLIAECSDYNRRIGFSEFPVSGEEYLARLESIFRRYLNRANTSLLPPKEQETLSIDVAPSVGRTPAIKVDAIAKIFSRVTISITPTQYPNSLDDPIGVQNYLTIDIHSGDFKSFNEKIDELLFELRRSNIISGDIREKLVAEIAAGRVILNSPKPDRKMIEILLVRPLMYIGDKAAGPLVGAAALAALAALGKITGMF